MPKGIREWIYFENAVAHLFKLGKKKNVVQNFNLLGHHIDIYFEDESASRQVVRTAVECKYDVLPIPINIVNSFIRIVKRFQEKDLIDKGIIVSFMGFTEDAKRVAKENKIELTTKKELENFARKYGSIAETKEKSIKPLTKSKEKLLFVVMPFDESFDDIYWYGIRGAAEKTGYICLRADEIEHNKEIIEQIIDCIDRAAAIVAVMTDYKPNVCYEVGFAHGRQKDVILVAKKGTELPFDFQGINHIFYDKIQELEEKLTARLNEMTTRN
ncbi:MAG: restriction endonuclease [Promethearchaeota archaeon]